MPIFQLTDQMAQQIRPSSFSSERELQRLFEKNLEELLGVRFIATEFATGDRQRGRIDTLGVDQDGTPTIIEYKKTSTDNVINQGLFYLDWLVDHKGDFAMAANQALNEDVDVDWSSPRLILIAEGFNEYDKYAVNRIGANIELWTYRLFAGGLLQLDPLFVPEASRIRAGSSVRGKGREIAGEEYTLETHLEGKSSEVQELMMLLRERLLELGEESDIVEKANKNYVAYKHGKNFCEVNPQTSGLKIWVDIDPSELEDPEGIGRDVTDVGHHGTGQVEVRLDQPERLDYVMSLVKQAYRLTA